MYFWYNLCLCLLLPLMMLFLIGRKRSHGKPFLRWRLGLYEPDFLTAEQFSTRIWIHAASVGEINAIPSFVKLLRENNPEAWIGVSTMTATGLQIARTKIPEANRHFIVPLDLFFTARRAMRQIRPTLFLTVETEIWPNLLKYAKRYGAAIAMVNGRISVRKIGLYLRYQGFLHKVLRCYDVCSMILPVDAERIIAMGADPKKVCINGNVKFDSLSFQITTKTRSDVLAALHFTGTEKILVAGSTREGEEQLILQAYQKIKVVIPDLSLIIAPRHIRRSSEILTLVEQFGFQPLLRTQITETTVLTPNTIVILDTMGELFNVYAIAKLTFCGGSLVSLGGQNPLEPAAWGKVVLYGPSMEDFLDAKKFLEAVGAGITVRDHVELAEQVIALLGDEKHLENLGVAGKQAIEAQKGSSIRNLQLIQKLIIH